MVVLVVNVDRRERIMAALGACKDCGHGVSKTADLCPNCGARLKLRWYEVSPFIAILVVALFIVLIFAAQVGDT